MTSDGDSSQEEMEESPIHKRADLSDDRKPKRDSADEEQDTSSTPDEWEDLGQPPVVSNGMVEFSLAPVNAHLVCKLCSGYYRDPYTISECLHTFCKSCLLYAFSKGFHNCPDCNVDLGPDPYKTALSDRTLQELVDKVLFPRLQEQDDIKEREFYAKRGIRLKPEYEEDKNVEELNENHHIVINSPVNEELNFALWPETTSDSGYDMPALVRPCIRTSGKFKIVQVKKYLLKQLQISAGDPSVIEILCNGISLGNELSLTFVLRTIWLRPDEDLKLTYRFAE